MNNLKVVEIDYGIEFNNGFKLSSSHRQESYEQHYLDFSNLMIEEFEGLFFDLSGESFFERIEDFGIALIAKNGMRIRIPGYASNNGYYSSELDLCIADPQGKIYKSFDISDCQLW